LDTLAIRAGSTRGSRGGNATDREILVTLQDRAPVPVPVPELAELLGLAVDSVAVRMRSLVSLHYVELIDGAYAPDEEPVAGRPNAPSPEEVPVRTGGGSPAETGRIGREPRRRAAWSPRRSG
jgi:hypothetical protein